jgi:signal transduction histidine kinase
VRLIIEDNGIGMDDAVRQHAFDPFFTTKFGKGGSGLGLHIVFNIVSGVLGGKIDLESTPGRGSRFVVTLPRTAPADAEDHV